MVITGHDRDTVAALLFPALAACRALCPALADDAAAALVLAQPQVHAAFQAALDRVLAQGTGSATRVTRALLLEEPPSLDLGEATDKGSINQRMVLKHRSQLVRELYLPQPSARTLVAQPGLGS